MKIGIGATTYNRPAHIKLWQEQVRKHTNLDACEVFIASDSYIRRGIAYRKNECLKALKDCDYIFLFDDDCFPVNDGWTNFFIEAHKGSGQHHFLYLKETGTIRKIREHTAKLATETLQINEYDNCGGCFMFLTKEAVEKVGGYHKSYGYYGYEHAGFTTRIHHAGLTSMGMYLCPSGTEEYVYAMDYDFHLSFNKQVKHASSMAEEISNVPGYIEQNYKIYLQDIQTVTQPL